MQESKTTMTHAKEVPMKEAYEWLSKHKDKTWSLGMEGWKAMGKVKGAAAIKYIDFHFDTRDWVVWKITGRGLGGEFAVSTHDEFEGTILELLEKRLDF